MDWIYENFCCGMDKTLYFSMGQNHNSNQFIKKFHVWQALSRVDFHDTAYMKVIAIFYTEKWTFEIICRLSYRAKRVKKYGK